MKTLTIGDTHGKWEWKILTHGSAEKFYEWRKDVELGRDPKSPYYASLPYMKYDKIIFIGDYVDSFTHTNVEILHNLNEIMFFSQQLADRVVLLLGNHDVQYIVENHGCSGFRPEMKFDLADFFRQNESRFKIAHEEIDTDGMRYLWTHAGVSKSWLKVLKDRLGNPKHRLQKVFADALDGDISELLNLAWEARAEEVFMCDYMSGGRDQVAGPLWIRPAALNPKGLPGYTQIVGHTVMKDIAVKKAGLKEKHYFVDVLDEHITGLELDIDQEKGT